MLSKVQLAIALAVVVIFGIMGVKIYIQEQKIITCNANTKLQKELFKKAMDGYEYGIINIDNAYKERFKNTDEFERRTNETDCDASKRFFDSRSYE